MRIGFGYDSHRLEQGLPFVLGGVTIPFDKGPAGHSDADVLCHAIADAILGAAAFGDIGDHFPDTDAAYEGASSLMLLKEVADKVKNAGFSIGNVDTVIIAEAPKLSPFRERMIQNLSEILGLDSARISVKAKTNEGCDAAGRGEAVVSYAAVVLEESERPVK